MPSGAKKRKAKKKKENQPNTEPDPSSASTHGDDAKNPDDKRIEVGEVCASASQVHHSLPSVDEGEETTERGITAVEEERVVQIDKEFEIDYNSNEKDGGSSGSYSGSSSSTGSSDDESHDIKSSPAVVDNFPVVDLVKPAELLSETAAEAIHIATIQEAGVSAVETPVVDEIVPLMEKVEEDTSSSISKENGGEMLSSVEGKAGISTSLMDEPAEGKEAEICVQSVENITTVSDPKECLVPENEATVDNGAEREKKSENTELLQPFLGVAEQKASWKSCCGLCELFGSR